MSDSYRGLDQASLQPMPNPFEDHHRLRNPSHQPRIYGALVTLSWEYSKFSQIACRYRCYRGHRLNLAAPVRS